MTGAATLLEEPSEVAALLGTARRAETPCGAGRMVWHAWGKGPPLVLFHGGSGSWRHWLRIIPRWSDRRRVLVPDLPGLGESDLPPEPGTIETIAGVVAGGLEVLTSPEEACDIVGFSFGATVAAHAAVRLGARVRSTTLVGAGGLVPARRPILLEKVRGKAGEALVEAHRTNLARMMIADPAKIDALALALQDWNSRHARLDTRGFAAEGALRRALGQLRTPANAVWGAEDQPAYWGLRERQEALRALCPDARIRIVPKAGHWIAHENPEALDATLREFLETPRPQAAGT
ncbi:MAG TPA: alpha/beta fold hydrolase [Roseomonas sp.]